MAQGHQAMTDDIGPEWPDDLRERIHHAAHRRMLPVLHLDPVLRPAPLIGTVAALRDRALQPELARLAEKVRSYLALLKWIYEYPSGRPRRSRARLALRIDSGRRRRSSPSIASTSKARAISRMTYLEREEYVAGNATPLRVA